MSSHNDEKRRVNRREALKAIGFGAAGLSVAYGVSPTALEQFRKKLKDGSYRAQFFTDAELETVRVLADMIIPADDRSGGATDAGTVEYADFVLSISGKDTQNTWREGLVWLDSEGSSRFEAESFVECTEAARALILNDIAFPERASEEFQEKTRWFNRVRDLVGSGFFSSRIGVDDIGYIGNVYNPRWQGAPPEALTELGVSYDDWNARYGDME